MTDLIMTQAARYMELKGRRKELEDELDSVKEESKTLSDGMVAAMEESGVETFAVSGVLFYIKVKVHASVPAERRETLIKRLRARKLGHLVRPEIHSGTLTSFVKEQLETNGGNLPAWMEDLVNVFSAPEIATRKR